MGFQRRDVLIGGVASAATATLAFIDRAKAAGDPEVKSLCSVLASTRRSRFTSGD